MTQSFLDETEFSRRATEIDHELRDIVTRLWEGNAGPTAAAITAALAKLFGGSHNPHDRAQFFLYVAPRMRRFTIAASRTGPASGTLNLRAVDLDYWLAQLETHDPECVRMIDLCYFTGLTVRETAAALGYPNEAVIRQLRFAKAWLQARVRGAQLMVGN